MRRSELRKALELSVVETNDALAVKNRDRRGNGAALAHDLLDGMRCLKILRIRHPVCDDGALERNDRMAGRDRGLHIRSHAQVRRVARRVASRQADEQQQHEPHQ